MTVYVEIRGGRVVKAAANNPGHVDVVVIDHDAPPPERLPRAVDARASALEYVERHGHRLEVRRV